jgi:hypothetical protein
MKKFMSIFLLCKMMMTVFWDVAPCSLVEVYRPLRGAYCLRHEGDENNLFSRHRKNLKSHQIKLFVCWITTHHTCGSGGESPRILNLGTRLRWAVTVIFRLLDTRGKRRRGLHPGWTLRRNEEPPLAGNRTAAVQPVTLLTEICNTKSGETTIIQDLEAPMKEDTDNGNTFIKMWLIYTHAQEVELCMYEKTNQFA